MANKYITEFKPCDKYGNCPYPEGCMYSDHLGYYRTDNGKYKPCHFREEHTRKNNYMVYLLKNGLLSKKDYTFANYVGTNSVNSVRRLMEISLKPDSILGTNFYIYGPNGTQKTTMVKAMCRRIAEIYINTGKIVRFTSMSDLVKKLNDVQESYYKDDEDFAVNANYEADLLKRADILVLDESFDIEKMKAYKSKWNLDLLDSFIRTRMDDAEKSTFYISNIQPQLIDSDFFGYSIRDLIDRDTEVLKFFDRYDSTVPVRRA